MEWYKLTPVDTLYFRGAEPMNLGENHTASRVFPPPAHTVSGALRTAVLVQNNIPFEDYGKHSPAINPDVIKAIGKAGEPAPFHLIGPLFMEKGETYVPAPYSWFGDKDADSGESFVVKAKPVTSRLIRIEGSDLLWAKPEKDKGELASLGGKWIKAADLLSDSPSKTVRPITSFFEDEPRTGIALERNRNVRKGRLYSFNHARLGKDVALVFGIDITLPLSDKGVLKIGAEQRFGWCEKLPRTFTELDFSREGNHFMALSNVEGTAESNSSVVATGKILYFGGWDLKTGFHKPMKGFFPAGTVFNKKFNHNLIAIKGV